MKITLWQKSKTEARTATARTVDVITYEIPDEYNYPNHLH
jgi:hypothetical protein